MAFKKNQKSYNTQVMNAGKEATSYLRNAMSLLNKYTSDYSGRLDYFTNKLNNRQTDLLSDKYLAQNAAMLRGNAAFGSNSETNRQIENNAYTQQNYLANVQNENVKTANQLQMNELQGLGNAAQIYDTPIQRGATAAQSVDAANSAWASALGKGVSAVGSVVKMIPGWGTAIGSAMETGGNMLSGMTTEDPNQYQYFKNQYQDAAAQFATTPGGHSTLNFLSNPNSVLSTIRSKNVNTPTTLGTFSGTSNYNPGWGLNYNK